MRITPRELVGYYLVPSLFVMYILLLSFTFNPVELISRSQSIIFSPLLLSTRKNMFRNHFERIDLIYIPYLKDEIAYHSCTMRKLSRLKQICPTFKYSCGSWVGLNVFNNLFFSTKLYFSDGRVNYGAPLLSKLYWNKLTKIKEVNVICEFESILVVFHIVLHIYGHFIHDFIAVWLIIPEEIKRNSVLILDENYMKIRNANEIINDFNVFKYRYFVIGKDDAIYSKKIYYVNSPRRCSNGIPLCKRVREFYMKYFSTGPPSMYVLHRRVSNTRTIMNFDELFSYVKKNIPNYDWKVLVDSFKSMRESILVHSSIKLLVGSTGSNIVNTLFFKESSGTVYFLTSHIDTPIILLTEVAHVWSYFFRLRDHSYHHFAHNITLTKHDFKVLKFCITQCLYAIKNHKWLQEAKCAVIHPLDNCLESTKQLFNIYFNKYKYNISKEIKFTLGEKENYYQSSEDFIRDKYYKEDI